MGPNNHWHKIARNQGKYEAEYKTRSTLAFNRSVSGSCISVKTYSINQSKLVTPRRRWGTPIDASAMIVAHRRLSSATRSNDDIEWPVHYLMLSFHDLRGLPLRRLPFTEPVVWSLAAYHGRTMIRPNAIRNLVEKTTVTNVVCLIPCSALSRSCLPLVKGTSFSGAD